MRQIHQLTQVLVQVISTLVGLKTPGQAKEAVEISSRALSEQLDLDVKSLLEMNAEEMIQELEEHPGMNHENLEYVADLFFELASILFEEEGSDIDFQDLLKRSLLIYKYIESEGNIYSIDRNNRIEEIEKLL